MEYFTAICYNLWPFGIVCGHLVIFPRFGKFGPRKIWQPWTEAVRKKINQIFIVSLRRKLDEEN
jgi:hypothetical protein